MSFRLQGKPLLAAPATSQSSAARLMRWLGGTVYRVPMLLAIVAVSAFAILSLIRDERPEVVLDLPAVPMINLDGETSTTDVWLGTPLVVNVWATWCPPCRVEMPSLVQLGKKLEPDRIRVVALSVDDDQHLVREFMLKHGIDLPVGISTSPTQAMSALGVAGIPLTLYVNADGRIVGRHVGERDWSDEAVVGEVRTKLLGQ